MLLTLPRKAGFSASSASRGSSSILDDQLQRSIRNPLRLMASSRRSANTSGGAVLHNTFYQKYAKICCAQMLHHNTFVAAGRLNPDSREAKLVQARCQSSPARQSVGDLPAFGTTVNRNLELRLRRINTRCRYVKLRHLLRPYLVKRTKLYRQPSASDEVLTRSRYRAAKRRQGRLDPSPRPAAGHPQAIPLANPRYRGLTRGRRYAGVA